MVRIMFRKGARVFGARVPSRFGNENLPPREILNYLSHQILLEALPRSTLIAASVNGIIHHLRSDNFHSEVCLRLSNFRRGCYFHRAQSVRSVTVLSGPKLD